MTIIWVTGKDFSDWPLSKRRHAEEAKSEPGHRMVDSIDYQIVYVSYIFVIPAIFVPLPFCK